MIWTRDAVHRAFKAAIVVVPRLDVVLLSRPAQREVRRFDEQARVVKVRLHGMPNSLADSHKDDLEVIMR